MERLTGKNKHGGIIVHIEGVHPEVAVDRAIRKCSAYEDTGLTPERCAELAAAEAEGRLIVLPCKVGDTVYLIPKQKIYRADKEPPITAETVIDIGVENVGCDTGKQFWIYIDPSKEPDSMELLGKTVLLTRAEAEAALAAGKGGDNA